jgi:protein TonB
MSTGADFTLPKSKGSQLIESAFAPFAKFFAINKFAASATMAVVITVGLFFLMVALISLGDSSIKTDNSRKLADIIMPERDIDTLLDVVDKPEEPEQQPDDIAEPEVDLQPLAGVDVSLPKPKANFPLFKVTPIYPRRAQERGIMGYAIVAFTITETGTVEDVVPLEGWCGDPRNEATEYRECSLFNSAASRAALKLKYKPKIVDGNAVKVFDVPHKFTFILEDE